MNKDYAKEKRQEYLQDFQWTGRSKESMGAGLAIIVGILMFTLLK